MFRNWVILTLTLDISQRFWQAWLIDELVDTSNDIDALKERVTLAHRLSDNEEAKAWYLEVAQSLDNDIINFTKWTDESERDFDRQTQWFDNIKFQREHLEEACRLLRTPWSGPDSTILRMPLMSLSQ
ncbi:hypothetical protein MMC28_006534 [Mycoblastus sanguinarius]|nr:hypothetical protein [Mycoblastus sanguinarius]